MTTENKGSTSEFEAFVASEEVEIGASESTEENKPEPRRNPPKPAVEKEAAADPEDEDGDETNAPEDEDGDETDTSEEGDEADEGDKKKPSAKESQINRLKREKAELARKLREAEASKAAELAGRLENLENLLQGGKGGVKSDNGKPEPDPTDTDKYPLGHLDDRYIEDKLDWLAEKKATERADAVLQRQQESERNQAVEQQHKELLVKVDDLSTRGSELYDDFQESVVESGMRGDWDLSQATFEAAHEAENGAQILYELSQDPKEAARVAKLSPYQQMKFVDQRDAEISKVKTGRKIPKAGEPPKNTARGANSRTHINPATENLDDFEKAWENDAKGGRG